MSGQRGEAIRLEGLFAGYGAADIIREASLKAFAGRVTTIAGPNGAGKSTLMKAIVGLLRPRAGRILIGEREITRLDAPSRAAAGLGYVPQEHNVFKNLTVGENLKVGFEFIRSRATRREFIAARDKVFALFPDLSSRLGDLAGTLSGGQRQMLAIGCAMMPSPSALLLDEPSAGLSPRNVGVMLDAVRQVNRAGVTVLLIEQNLVEAMRVSDDAVLLAGGEIRGRWPAGEFLSDAEVRRLFMGGAEAANDPGGRRGSSAA
jgi:ABC-type branched-subunit amino acid transport system ATPase component